MIDMTSIYLHWRHPWLVGVSAVVGYRMHVQRIFCLPGLHSETRMRTYLAHRPPDEILRKLIHMHLILKSSRLGFGL